MYRLDPGNPPKSCPDCKITGESFKVKVFQLNEHYEGVILCTNNACKWPLNKFKPESFLVQDVREQLKRKKEKKNKQPDATNDH